MRMGSATTWDRTRPIPSSSPAFIDFGPRGAGRTPAPLERAGEANVADGDTQARAARSQGLLGHVDPARPLGGRSDPHRRAGPLPLLGPRRRRQALRRSRQAPARRAGARRAAGAGAISL